MSVIQVVRFLVMSAALYLIQGCGEESSNGLSAAQPLARDNNTVLSVEYAAMRKQQLSNVNYRLSVVLDAQSSAFFGSIDINFDLASSNAAPLTVDFNDGVVNSVSINGEVVPWDYNDSFISLAPTLFAAGKNTLTVNYSHAYNTDGAGIHRFKDPENGEVYLYTNFEPYEANRLFPHFDQPNIKARYVLDVIAPSHWQVVSVMREQSNVKNVASKTRHWIFPESLEISSYVFALHAGPYHVWEERAGDIPLRLFARSAMAQYVKTDDWFAPTKQSFEFFNDYFALPYPFVKYDQLIVPDFNGGAMENVAAVTFAERYVSRGEKTTAQRLRLANVIAHEMAHMWFGNLVTMDWWNGLWLNESFATYMANLQLEKASDFEDTWDTFYATTKLWAYEADQQATTHAIELPVATTADAFTNFDGITYGKGASVLKQLSHYLGEDVFREGVRQYLKKYAYQNTSLDDFVGALATAANKDLGEWQQQWLFKTGLNTVELSYTCEQGLLNELILLQTAPKEWPTLRQQRVQIGLYQLQKEKMQLQKLIPITYSGASTVIEEAVGQPCPALVYPNVGDWAYTAVRLDKKSFATVQQHINAFPQSGMRMMLWQHLWESARAARLPLDAYIEFVIDNIAAEKDRNVVLLVTESLLKAYDYLAVFQGQPALDTALVPRLAQLRETVETLAWQQLHASKPGGDIQEQWFELVYSTTHTSSGLKKVEALLTGELIVDGLDIDQDKRWALTVSLNHYHYGRYVEFLAAEVKRDPSDLGVKMAIQAEVSRPDRALKEKWLNTIVQSLLYDGETGDDDKGKRYKYSEIVYATEAIFPSDQRAMLEPFAEMLLTTTAQLNEQASELALDTFATDLLPASCNEMSVARLEKAVVGFSDFKPAAVKAYKIGLQEDQRCVDIFKRFSGQ
ncbi:MAG: aminopeptidase N [Pseudomonadales bacterium]